MTVKFALLRGVGMGQKPRKGVLAKGVSVESSVTAKETKNTQGYWPQQYIWHSERRAKCIARHTFCKNPLLKTPFSWFLNGGHWGKSSKNAVFFWWETPRQ